MKTTKVKPIGNLVASFNAFRASRGLGAVQPQTVTRYVDGNGSGSRLFDQFIKQYLKARI